MESPVALHGLAGHRSALGKCLVAGRLHGARMAEYVGGAVLGLEEPVSLHRHEPLHQGPDRAAGWGGGGLQARSGPRLSGLQRARGLGDAVAKSTACIRETWGPLRRLHLAGDRRAFEKEIETDRLQGPLWQKMSPEPSGGSRKP